MATGTTLSIVADQFNNQPSVAAINVSGVVTAGTVTLAAGTGDLTTSGAGTINAATADLASLGNINVATAINTLNLGSGGNVTINEAASSGNALTISKATFWC